MSTIKGGFLGRRNQTGLSWLEWFEKWKWSFGLCYILHDDIRARLYVIPFRDMLMDEKQWERLASCSCMNSIA
jgi:hypothetical protein